MTELLFLRPLNLYAWCLLLFFLSGYTKEEAVRIVVSQGILLTQTQILPQCCSGGFSLTVFLFLCPKFLQITCLTCSGRPLIQDLKQWPGKILVSQIFSNSIWNNSWNTVFQSIDTSPNDKDLSALLFGTDLLSASKVQIHVHNLNKFLILHPVNFLRLQLRARDSHHRPLQRSIPSVRCNDLQDACVLS